MATTEPLYTWDHAAGVCKLFPVPRTEIDEDSDEPDAWDLIWIEASSGVRRFEARLDNSFGRRVENAEAIREYLASAPSEAVEIVSDYL